MHSIQTLKDWLAFSLLPLVTNLNQSEEFMLGQLRSHTVTICEINFAPAPGKPHCLGGLASEISPNFLKLFQEYELHVNNQCFSHVDDLDSQLSAMELSIEVANNGRHQISKLQIYPSTGDVSFVLGQKLSI
jgi:hypothetical protein